MDEEQLRENAHKMVDFIADYYKNIESFPVLSQVQVLPNLTHPLFPLYLFLYYDYLTFVFWLIGLVGTCNIKNWRRILTLGERK